MKDFNRIIQEHFGKLSDEELSIISKYFQEDHLQRNDFFTKSDKICDKMSIVKSGILRIYCLSDGKDITQWISTENFIITEVCGFFFDQPNRWNIQALTDTKLLTINKADYYELCSKFPKWNDIEKRFIVKCFAMIEERVFYHLSMTAEQRYNVYFEQNKDLFNKVPLQYIASVLGMSSETFSRIRKRQNTNS